MGYEINSTMQNLWFSWVKEDNVQRTGTIFWVYMCCSPARGVTVLDHKQEDPFKLCLDQFCLWDGGKEEFKWGSNQSLKKIPLKKETEGRGKWGEMMDRWTFLGNPTKCLQDNAENRRDSENRRDTSLSFPSLLIISSDNIHITHKISKILLRQDGSQHGLQLFVTLRASSAVS